MNRISTIIFVCEHGSAKSVIAAAHFNKLARDENLEIHAVSRGTNPDLTIPPNVTEGLKEDALIVDEPKPKKLDQEEAAKARQIITFSQLPKPYSENFTIEDWSDVPPVSEDYGKARDEIITRIKQLLDDLKLKQILED